ncbi:VWFA domain-containing protein, variant 2 [Balamuthia mandrillaris]
MEATRTASTPNELCQVVVEPSSTHALRGVVNNVQVLFSVNTGTVEEKEETKRPPINLCVVLDRSGSMDSLHKLENAKKAIKKVIEALGAEDILHLVLYGSQVETLFSNASVGDYQQREVLLKKVDGVRTEGCTNMHAGLSQGASVVKEFSKSGYTNRIFLFSDGLVNEGITDKREIYTFISKNIYTEMDIKVSAFGLGSDFDEDLMKNIAEHGSGAYFFIEGSDAIPRFVDFALKGLFKLVGTDGLLRIRGLNGSTVTKIYSHDDLIKPFKFDDLKQEDRRAVVCELQVTPSAQPSGEVLKWELEYRPASNASETLSCTLILLITFMRSEFFCLTWLVSWYSQHGGNSGSAELAVHR